MSTTKASTELIDFIASGISTEQVAAFQPSEETRARFWELVDAKKQGSITAEEAAERETYLQIEHLMRMAKARARQILSVSL